MATFIAGVDGIIQLDNASDTLTDISQSVGGFALQVAYQIGTFYTLGLSGAQNTEGQRTWTGSISFRPTLSSDTTEAARIINDWVAPGAGNNAGARSLRLEVPNAAAGAFRYDMEIYPTTVPVAQTDAGGDGTPSLLQAQFNVDGDVTLTIVT